MKIAVCETYSIISISGDFLFLKEMMQNHIGTILIGELNNNFLGNIPDYVSHSTKLLQKILTKEVKGYAAEVYTTYTYSYGGESLLNYKKIIRLNNGELKETRLCFGGRYYALSHQYICDDPLSVTVREFKSRYIKSVDMFCDSVITFLSSQIQIDILTYIPLKPGDKENDNLIDF